MTSITSNFFLRINIHVLKLVSFVSLPVFTYEILSLKERKK